jgi:tetratricopeptide (TPR) repeat protein
VQPARDWLLTPVENIISRDDASEVTIPILLWLSCHDGIQNDTFRVAEQLERKALELAEQGLSEQAVGYQEQALARRRELSVACPGDLALAHYNLARLYLDLGRLREAENQARAARQIGSRFTSAELARLAVLTAQIHFRSRRYPEAEVELRAALPELAGVERSMALSDLGMTRAALGDLIEGQTFLESSLAAFEDAGAKGPVLGRILANHGLICFHLQDLNTATASYTRAIFILESSLNPDVPVLGIVLAELSQILRKSGRKAEAKNYEKRARAILGEAADRSLYTVDIRSLR